MLLPILGEQYGVALEAGQLKLELDAPAGRFRVRYYDTVLPISPRSYGSLLTHRLDRLQHALGAEDPRLLELKSLITWFATLPPRTESDPDRLAARRREQAMGHERLRALLAASPEIRSFVEDNVRLVNGTPGDARSFDLLDALLADQAYRVAFWRVAGEEINYRRFFDINELAAIRVERREVFAATHALVFRLVGDGIVTGLRVDHPDGLYAPAEYFQRLQRACGGDFYVVVEKILAPGEPLRETWATDGTTGYEFLNLVNGIFVDRAQARAMDLVYRRLVRDAPTFGELVRECKRLIMETSMASELSVLAHRLNTISEKHRSSRDFTLASLTTALREIVAAFPVYRTYVGESGEVTAVDREYITRAVAQARRRSPTMSSAVYDWIHELLLLKFPTWVQPPDRRERVDFVMRLQQFTGPVMAKGYEDTALYRYHRLVSLNDVGGDPGRFGVSLAEFHAEHAARRARSPHALSATSTHDTKRSEDVRARINVLSEIPGEWRARVTVWQTLNRRHRTDVDGRPVPESNTEYLIYQTLVGAWPIDAARLRDYVLKAAHEAKVATSWINPDPRYNAALARFAEAIVDPVHSGRFLDDFVPFQARIAHWCAFNALAQTLVKITAPGVPDFYQGTELWDLSLVDPDNRRPVDWARRRATLDELRRATAAAGDNLAGVAADLVKRKEDGRVKMFAITRALAARARHAALFADGAYRPLETRGALGDSVCAFARTRGEETALTIVPRLIARHGGDSDPLGAAFWGDTAIDVPVELGMRFRNALTGERVAARDGALAAADVFGVFPAALLEREGP